MTLLSFTARRVKTALLAPLAVSALIAASSSASLAQWRVPVEEVRAINFARSYAVALNGGLQAYRPAPCMFVTASTDNPCLVKRSPDGFLFRFLGGPPAWVERQQPATLETEVLISPDGRNLVKLIFNGAPRRPASQAPAPAS
jgi:hypothetical protein